MCTLSVVVAGTCLGLTLASQTAQAQDVIEKQPLGQYIRTQLQMVAIPPLWQAFIGPGSIIYVDWDTRVHGTRAFGYRYYGKFLESPPTDLPTNLPKPIASQIKVGALKQLKSNGLDLSVMLGKFNPSLSFGNGSSIDYANTTYEVSGWGLGSHGTTDAINGSPTLTRYLTDGTYDFLDQTSKRWFKYMGQGYLVTTVVSVKKLRVDVTKEMHLSVALKALNGKECTKSIPVSQLKEELAKGKDAPADPGSTTPKEDAASNDSSKPKIASKQEVKDRIDKKSEVSKDQAGTPVADSKDKNDTNTEAAPDAQTIFEGVALTDATVKFCRYSDYSYDLDVDPAIPIAFLAHELEFERSGANSGKAKVKGSDLKDLHDAMKFPD